MIRNGDLARIWEKISRGFLEIEDGLSLKKLICFKGTYSCDSIFEAASSLHKLNGSSSFFSDMIILSRGFLVNALHSVLNSF